MKLLLTIFSAWIFICSVMVAATAIAIINPPGGTEIILKPYTTASCPVVPYDADQASHVNEHWIVIETIYIQHEGVTYPVLRLLGRFGTGALQWSGNAGAYTLAPPGIK